MCQDMRHVTRVDVARPWAGASVHVAASAGFGAYKQINGTTTPTNHPARRLGVSPP